MSNAKLLVDDYEKYMGQYVTTSSFDSTVVVTWSSSAKEAYQQAIAKHVPDPVLIYIPTNEDVVCRRYVTR